MRKFAALFVTLAVLASGWIYGTPDAQASTQVSGDAVGFSSGAPLLWESQTDQARDLDAMAATGAKWLRLDFPWPSVQPTATSWNWAPFDRIVSMARARGFSILGLPSYTPGWAKASGAVGAAGPANPSTFANFVSALVTRYGPQGVKTWEIWNEPNQSWSWNPPSPAAYTAVLKAAYTAVKAIDATATVITAGLAPAPDAVDGSQVAPPTFVNGIYANGGKGYFDAVATHPYSYPSLPADTLTATWSPWYQLSVIHQKMVDNGDGAKKIWLTEMGAPTGTGSGAVTEARQVDYVNSTFTAREQRASWLGPLFWYAGRDHGTSLSDREQNFGLWRYDFSAKPSAAAFASHIGQAAPTTTTTVPPTTTTVPPTTTSTTVPPTTTTSTTVPQTTTTTVPQATVPTAKRKKPGRR